jgi:hypothetical protein
MPFRNEDEVASSSASKRLTEAQALIPMTTKAFEASVRPLAALATLAEARHGLRGAVAYVWLSANTPQVIGAVFSERIAQWSTGPSS